MGTGHLGRMAMIHRVDSRDLFLWADGSDPSNHSRSRIVLALAQHGDAFPTALDPRWKGRTQDQFAPEELLHQPVRVPRYHRSIESADHEVSFRCIVAKEVGADSGALKPCAYAPRPIALVPSYTWNPETPGTHKYRASRLEILML